MPTLYARVIQLETDPTRFKFYRPTLKLDDVTIKFEIPDDECEVANSGLLMSPQIFMNRVVIPWAEAIDEAHNIRLHLNPADEPESTLD